MGPNTFRTIMYTFILWSVLSMAVGAIVGSIVPCGGRPRAYEGEVRCSCGVLYTDNGWIIDNNWVYGSEDGEPRP
jgi:hypothetical protein